MTARKIFADLLRGHREQRGWSRAEAAPRLNLSESLLEKMERGERKPVLSVPAGAWSAFLATIR
jgi:ribosome-binding protein aMBF1 (putative translation factor)